MARPRLPANRPQLEHVTVYFQEGQTLKLDKLLLELRERAGIKLSRSQLLRTLAEALIESEIALLDVSSQSELQSVLTKKLRR